MNFSNDRDLLALEPTVFTDVPFASQQRLHVSDATLAGTTLSSPSADFTAAQVEAGSIVLVAGLTCEVLMRRDSHSLTVSLPRSRTTDPALAPPVGESGGSGGDLEICVRTFAPQAALVHDMLLRLVGIDPDDAAAVLNEDAIVSLNAMARLEALGTLERVYSAALTVAGDNEGLRAKADKYRAAFAAACRRAVVLIDADGDGYADIRRRASVVNLVRV